jgi:hypothetical protein
MFFDFAGSGLLLEVDWRLEVDFDGSAHVDLDFG